MDCCELFSVCHFNDKSTAVIGCTYLHNTLPYPAHRYPYFLLFTLSILCQYGYCVVEVRIHARWITNILRNIMTKGLNMSSFTESLSIFMHSGYLSQSTMTLSIFLHINIFFFLGPINQISKVKTYPEVIICKLQQTTDICVKVKNRQSS